LLETTKKIGEISMKTLLLMRHGKSSWKDDSLSDHERPLKKRGRRDSQRIAEIIVENDLYPDIILCSSAKRTKETAKLVMETLNYDNKVSYLKSFYMGEPDDFINALNELSNKNKVVLIVAHNPGLEALIQIMDGEIESLPTAALGQLVLAIDDWKDLTLESMGELVGFWKPKELHENK
jgi:phosphohistidine phosphatase